MHKMRPFEQELQVSEALNQRNHLQVVLLSCSDDLLDI